MNDQLLAFCQRYAANPTFQNQVAKTIAGLADACKQAGLSTDQATAIIVAMVNTCQNSQ